MDILVDQFDYHGQDEKAILHIGICPDCGRETILVDERCSLCWEKRFQITIGGNEESPENATGEPRCYSPGLRTLVIGEGSCNRWQRVCERRGNRLNCRGPAGQPGLIKVLFAFGVNRYIIPLKEYLRGLICVRYYINGQGWGFYPLLAGGLM